MEENKLQNTPPEGITPAGDEEEKQLLFGKKLALTIASILDAKKAQDIKIININKKTIIADYFVIAGGSSRTQVNSLADEVEYKLKEAGYEPHHIEGERSEWICLDYVGCVIHILLKQQRGFYQIERLWEDGEKVDIDDIIVKD